MKLLSHSSPPQNIRNIEYCLNFWKISPLKFKIFLPLLNVLSN